MERSNSMMRKKRGLDSNDSEEGGNSNNKRPAFASVVEEAGKMDNLQQLRSYLASIIHTELRSSMAPIIRTELSSLGPILRKVVSEEIELALAKLDPTRMTGRCGSACSSLPQLLTSLPHTHGSAYSTVKCSLLPESTCKG